MTLNVAYRSSGDYLGFPHSITTVVPSDESKRSIVFIPVFYQYAPVDQWPDPAVPVSYGFAGLDVPAEDALCVSRLSRVADPAQFELLVPANLPPGWIDRPLHQSLALF